MSTAGGFFKFESTLYAAKGVKKQRFKKERILD
jgi:hypothetical protein